MNLSKVRFVIESQSVNNKSMSLCISCNNKTYTFDKLEQINNIDIEVKFPSICKFETFGKDPKDTIIDENGKIIPQRVTNMSRSVHTRITKAIKQARFLSLM